MDLWIYLIPVYLLILQPPRDKDGSCKSPPFGSFLESSFQGCFWVFGKTTCRFEKWIASVIVVTTLFRYRNYLLFSPSIAKARKKMVRDMRSRWLNHHPRGGTVNGSLRSAICMYWIRCKKTCVKYLDPGNSSRTKVHVETLVHHKPNPHFMSYRWRNRPVL